MSYAFHGAGLLDEALDSTGFMSWGEAGKGTWVTTYANAGHSYMVVAGLRFDTSGRADDGSRWHTEMRSASGYTVRHPRALRGSRARRLVRLAVAHDGASTGARRRLRKNSEITSPSAPTSIRISPTVGYLQPGDVRVDGEVEDRAGRDQED